MQTRIGVWQPAFIGLTLLFAACNGNGSGGNTNNPAPTTTPAATRTPTGGATVSATPTRPPQVTPTPTTTPGTGAVSALVVLHSDVRASAGDAVGLPPPSWAESPDGVVFDRALAYANWQVVGTAGSGTTGADGQFEIHGLGPGEYTMSVTKTLAGNLVDLRFPFSVGDDGSALVIASVRWGAVRVESTYTRGGRQRREVNGPYGSWLLTEEGRLSGFGDYGRRYLDPDGDGRFENQACTDQAWLCGLNNTCSDDRACQCVASCPFCEDCGSLICAPRGASYPYRCGTDGSCSQPGDRCICVSSCPDCDDCTEQVCVRDCEPVEVIALVISGQSQVVVGREASMYAAAQLSDGSTIDVTHVVEWTSSNETVATIDGWGTVFAHALGATTITAAMGEIESEPWSLEVVERPTLRRIIVQNVSCYYPLGRPIEGRPGPVIVDPSIPTDILPPPVCGQVVLIGDTVQFSALGEYEDNSYEDLTTEVEWRAEPANVGDISDGLFTAREVGVARISAALGSVVSNEETVEVVAEPTVIFLSIYPERGGIVPLELPTDPAVSPRSIGRPEPCFDCGFELTVLRGDTVQFHATAHYNTGAWEDVTNQVTWRSSDPVSAPIDSSGLLTAAEAGETTVDAVLDEVMSNPVTVRIVSEATLLSIYVYPEGNDRVVGIGEEAFFRAVGQYDVGFERDVTLEATWRSSDETVGGFDEPGVFTGRAAGNVELWAQLDGVESNRTPFEVFATSTLDFCDPANVNRGVWSDGFNRVLLESDCAQYEQGDVVSLRFTATEIQPRFGIFDPCLDLYAYQGDRLIRTIREEGCGEPFLPTSAPEFDDALLRYQLLAFWDLRDQQGNSVPPGRYTIYGRFYLYFDPVVSIDITVNSSGSGTLPPTPTPTSLPPGLESCRSCREYGDSCVLEYGGYGTVLDASTRSPVAGASVVVNELPPSVTDQTGRYDLRGSRNDTCNIDYVHEIRAVAEGYEPFFALGFFSAYALPLNFDVLLQRRAPDDGPTLTPVPNRHPSPTPTPTPLLICTPPPCPPGGSYHCPGECPGGCGTICVPPTPIHG